MTRTVEMRRRRDETALGDCLQRLDQSVALLPCRLGVERRRLSPAYVETRRA